LSAVSRINSSIGSVIKNFEELARSTVNIKSATSADIDLLANDIKSVSGTLRSQINELENASNALTSTLLKYSQALRTATHRNFN
jgi:hypothetical protein